VYKLIYLMRYVEDNVSELTHHYINISSLLTMAVE